MDRIYKYQKNVMQGKAKYGYGMSLLVILPPIIGIFIPFLFYDVLGHEENAVLSDVLTWTLIPMLLSSFYVMQKYQLLGRFGDSIMLLVPTFVWLISEYDDVIKAMLIVAMCLCVLMIGFFIGTIFFMRSKSVEKGARASMVTDRMKYSLASILITLSLSFLLIQWGDAGMGWLKDDKGVPNNSGKPWVMYIAVIAILIITLLVVEGMFHDLLTIRYRNIDEATTEINMNTRNKIKSIKRNIKSQAVKKPRKKKVASKTTGTKNNINNKD